MFQWFIIFASAKLADLNSKFIVCIYGKMKCQVEEKKHFRHLLLFQFNRKVSAAEAAWNIREVYGEDAMGASTAQKWFPRFKEGCFDLSDASRSGRTSDFDEERLNALIHDNPRRSTRELADIMECHHSAILRHLRSMGKVQKWVPGFHIL